MSDAILGEIRAYASATPPPGWASCEGQYLTIAESPALFELLGTRFGGDGVTTFGVPNLSCIVPMHHGTGPGLSPRAFGEYGGSPTADISLDQLPRHNHPVFASAKLSNYSAPAGSDPRVGDRMPGTPARLQGDELVPATDALLYAQPNGESAIVPTAMNSVTLSPGWGPYHLPHENRMPLLAIRYMIAIQGVIPTRPA